MPDNDPINKSSLQGNYQTMKIPKFFQILLIGLGSLTTIIAILIAFVFQATSGLTAAADKLFSELKEGNTKAAMQLFSQQVDDQTLEKELKTFARKNSLDDFKNTSWSNRSITMNSGTLEGSINLEDGTTIPVTISFQKSGSDWSIFSIKEKRSGVISSASTEGVPSEKDLLTITAETTDLFATSIKENNFQKLYSASSKTWQNETTPDQLEQAFKPFFKLSKNKQSLSYLNNLTRSTPAFTEEAIINDQNVLIIKGRYMIDPPYTFTYSYVMEGFSWKLLGLKVSI